MGTFGKCNPIQQYSYQRKSMTGVFRSDDDIIVCAYPFKRGARRYRGRVIGFDRNGRIYFVVNGESESFAATNYV